MIAASQLPRKREILLKATVQKVYFWQMLISWTFCFSRIKCYAKGYFIRQVPLWGLVDGVSDFRVPASEPLWDLLDDVSDVGVPAYVPLWNLEDGVTCTWASVRLGGWCLGCWGACTWASERLVGWCLICWGACTWAFVRLGRRCLGCWGACEWKKVKTTPQCKFNVRFNLRWQLTFTASVRNPLWVYVSPSL